MEWKLQLLKICYFYRNFDFARGASSAAASMRKYIGTHAFLTTDAREPLEEAQPTDNGDK